MVMGIPMRRSTNGKGIKVTQSTKGGMAVSVTTDLGAPFIEAPGGIPVVFVSGGGAAVPVPAAWEYNYTTTQFAGAREALLNVKNGVQREKMICVGESTMQGESAGDTDGFNNRKNEYVYRMTSIVAGKLATAGYPVNTSSMFGSGALNTVVGIADWRTGTTQIMPGVNFASPWDIVGTSGIVGGVSFNSAAAGIASITPQVTFDTIKLFDLTASGLGTGNYNIDGGANTLLTQTNATASYRTTTIAAGSVGTHTLNLERASGTFSFAGFHAYNSTLKELDVYNVGVGSAKIADLIQTTVAFSRLLSLGVVAAGAKIAIIKEQINDSVGGTSEASFKAGYNTLIDKLVAVGAPNITIILMTSQPSRIDVVSDATQQVFRQYVKDIALARGLPCFDEYPIFTDWVTMNANGYAFNANHMNKLGNNVEGSAFYTSLMKWCQL